MCRAAPSEELPAAHDDIDIRGVELKPVAEAAGHLRGDRTGARAEKRVIDHLAGTRVVDDRAAHAFDGLLRAVSPTVLALRVAKRVVVGDLPECRLATIALPGLTLPSRTAYQQVSCFQW